MKKRSKEKGIITNKEEKETEEAKAISTTKDETEWGIEGLRLNIFLLVKCLSFSNILSTFIR